MWGTDTMTRSSLDTTLRRAYIVLGLILLIAIIAKFADRTPASSEPRWPA